MIKTRRNSIYRFNKIVTPPSIRISRNKIRRATTGPKKDATGKYQSMSEKYGTPPTDTDIQAMKLRKEQEAKNAKSNIQATK